MPYHQVPHFRSRAIRDILVHQTCISVTARVRESAQSVTFVPAVLSCHQSVCLGPSILVVVQLIVAPVFVAVLATCARWAAHRPQLHAPKAPIKTRLERLPAKTVAALCAHRDHSSSGRPLASQATTSTQELRDLKALPAQVRLPTSQIQQASGPAAYAQLAINVTARPR